MRLEIEIPEAFEKHFNQDRFKDSLERIMADIKYQSDIGVSLMSGNYEYETIEMLEKAFRLAKLINEDGFQRIVDNIAEMNEMESDENE